jgi:hypothetical protein
VTFTASSAGRCFSNYSARRKGARAILATANRIFPLGLHQNRVTGFPRPTKRLAASRRKVVSKSAPADLDRCPRGCAGHVAIPIAPFAPANHSQSDFGQSQPNVPRVKLRHAAWRKRCSKPRSVTAILAITSRTLLLLVARKSGYRKDV